MVNKHKKKKKDYKAIGKSNKELNALIENKFKKEQKKKTKTENCLSYVSMQIVIK